MGRNKKVKYSCTACTRPITSTHDANLHPLIGCLVCRECYQTYGNGDFASLWEDGTDELGDDNYCRWCCDGGDLFGCNSQVDSENRCHYAFCEDCIKRNVPNDPVLETKEMSEEEAVALNWKCYACEKDRITELMKEAKLAIEDLNSQERKSNERTSINGSSDKRSKSTTKTTTTQSVPNEPEVIEESVHNPKKSTEREPQPGPPNKKSKVNESPPRPRLTAQEEENLIPLGKKAVERDSTVIVTNKRNRTIEFTPTSLLKSNGKDTPVPIEKSSKPSETPEKSRSKPPTEENVPPSAKKPTESASNGHPDQPPSNGPQNKNNQTKDLGKPSLQDTPVMPLTVPTPDKQTKKIDIPMPHRLKFNTVEKLSEFAREKDRSIEDINSRFSLIVDMLKSEVKDHSSKGKLIAMRELDAIIKPIDAFKVMIRDMKRLCDSLP